MRYVHVIILWMFFFFKQKTAYEMRISDWSSDVCSSDLTDRHRTVRRPCGAHCGEYFKREAQTVVEAAPVLIRPRVVQRRQEARQQIPVRRVKLDHEIGRAHV